MIYRASIQKFSALETRERIPLKETPYQSWKLEQLISFALLLLFLAALQSCTSSNMMKTVYIPQSGTPDTIGPNYLCTVSQIKYWDRITSADRATNFGWWDSTGQIVEMNTFYNKVIVLDFFSTWSPPSLDQLNQIDSARRAMPDTNVLYIGVTMREKATGGKAVVLIDSFARAHHLGYQILIGSRDFGFTYGGIDAVPTTFVITRKRRVAATFEGVVSTTKLLDAISKAEEKP